MPAPTRATRAAGADRAAGRGRGPAVTRDLTDLAEPGAVLPAVVLLVGDEEYLVSQRVGEVITATRGLDPAVEVTQTTGAEVEVADLAEQLAPSLFGDRRVMVIRAAHELRAPVAAALGGYLADPTDAVTLVLQHAGGAKGKAVLETARSAGAREVGCARLTRPEDRQQFVREEIRRSGGSIAGEAVALLVDAVGSDLRELAAAAAQLSTDCGGRIDADSVRAYHRGRAEVTGFAVSDLAVVGNAPAALESLRWALSVGVPHVVIADAMADGVRTVARVSSAGRGDAYAMASRLGMPPWKVKRAQSQARGWSDDGLADALGVVATLNADVKGAAVDPGWALEHAIRQLAAARAVR